MRLRNIPRAEGTLQAHNIVIKRPEDQKGCWRQVFGNKQPVHIEIGTGKGRFILNKAKANPDINFVGIEKYSNVLARAIKKYPEGLPNLRIICLDALKLEQVFAKEITTIYLNFYLNFSDPWPKARHAKRRLTSVEFLERYEKVLKPYGKLEFKTDNTELFKFSLEQIKEAGWTLQNFTYDLHHNEEMNQGNIMTEYEEKFSSKGNPINKLIAVRK